MKNATLSKSAFMNVICGEVMREIYKCTNLSGHLPSLELRGARALFPFHNQYNITIFYVIHQALLGCVIAGLF